MSHDDTVCLPRLSQVVGGRCHSITIMLSDRYKRAAVGAAAGRPPIANAAEERWPGAAQSCDRGRDAQERQPAQSEAPDATFPADLPCSLVRNVNDRNGLVARVIVVGMT